MSSVSKEGPTPNGGVRSTLFYLDSDGREADAKTATKLVIVEYDAAGAAIHRTYADVPNREPDPAAS